MLYVCPTPIGNLEDITLRVLNVLKLVDIILSEDTRSTRKILTYYNIHNKGLISYHKFNEKKQLERIIKILKDGREIALLSEAGTPAISDPGYILLKACIEEKVRFTVLPGATAIIPALLLSGFPPQPFTFWGFLPKKKGEKVKALKTISEIHHPVVIYISPHRLPEELSTIMETIGDVEVSLSKEITKQFEYTIRGKLSDIILKISTSEIKGEFTLTLLNREREPEEFKKVVSLVREVKKGLREKEIAKRIAIIYGKKPNEVYKILKGE